jgi:hypothetical protein
MIGNNKSIVIAVIYYYATRKIDRLPRRLCIILLSYCRIYLREALGRRRNNLVFFFCKVEETSWCRVGIFLLLLFTYPPHDSWTYQHAAKCKTINI